MDKRISVIYSIVALGLLSMAVFIFSSPEDRFDNTVGLSQMQTTEMVGDEEYDPQNGSGFNLIAGICALLLLGYLFWTCYRKFQIDSQAELIAMEDSLYEISLATGRTEYDLFCISAQDWSVSGDRIDQDFKIYMMDQVLPHYAKDFVRKNKIHLNESLILKKEVEPTSWSDWAKGLLVFPGSIVLLFSLTLLLD
jgi:hypothetical protein